VRANTEQAEACTLNILFHVLNLLSDLLYLALDSESILFDNHLICFRRDSVRLTIKFLRQEIERAEIVAEEVASSLVTIGTLVQFIDHKSHRISEGRLAFPEDVQAKDAISILSPLGSALLGLGPGQSIDWIDEAGQDHRLTVVAVLPPGAQARARR